ncbi:MAG: hypothetical protein HQ534_01425 [Armatimonadetes bacterium]|nr:hypothetical protein [Armatimonadota bacterium]
MSSEKTKLSWTSHPFIDFPVTSIFLVIFLIVLAVILWQVAVVIWDMPLFYYLGFAIFVFSMITYFIPTRYEFYEMKIIIYYAMIKIERNYSDFKCFYSDKKGIMLGTFMKPRKLDSFRGQSIRFSKLQTEKEDLIKLLEQKIGNQY